MTELQYEKKILELNQYLEQINSSIWDYIGGFLTNEQMTKKVLETLNEWAGNN